MLHAHIRGGTPKVGYPVSSSGSQPVSLRFLTFRNGLQPLTLIADTHYSFLAWLPGSEAANLPSAIVSRKIKNEDSAH